MKSHPIQISKWTDGTNQISEEAVRRRHVPADDFRISAHRREVGVRCPESTRNGVAYILSGSCSWSRDGDTVIAREGDVVQISEGSYQFAVLGDEPCDLIHVWNLKELWAQHNRQAEQDAADQLPARGESKSE